MTSLVKDFADLFSGNLRSYGQWDPATGNMVTEKAEVTEEHYRAHLEGRMGLGVVPVTDGGTCKFGCIDVDNHGKGSDGSDIDIAALAEIAHKHDCLLVVDNCFCTPALQQPIALGADIVIHSATKYIDGQGRCMGGAVCGTQDIVGDSVYGFLRTAGPTMSAFNAWVFLKGLETLQLRMQAHSANALALARWLEQHAVIERVYYPGLESHPQHALAKQQQSGFGGIVSFELKGGRKEAWKLIDATRMISITANLGDTKTTITHPATTTHGRLTPEQREAAGIVDGLVRVAVGLEDIEDIKADLARGM